MATGGQRVQWKSIYWNTVVMYGQCIGKICCITNYILVPFPPPDLLPDHNRSVWSEEHATCNLLHPCAEASVRTRWYSGLWMSMGTNLWSGNEPGIEPGNMPGSKPISEPGNESRSNHGNVPWTWWAGTWYSCLWRRPTRVCWGFSFITISYIASWYSLETGAWLRRHSCVGLHCILHVCYKRIHSNRRH